jgi:magnesium transporter
MDDKIHDEPLEAGEEYSPASGNLMETRTSKLDSRLLEQLEEAFHKQTSQVVLHDLVKLAADYSPIDLAYAAAWLPPYARPVVYANLPNLEAKIDFLINTGSNTRVAVFRDMDDEEVKGILEATPSDEAVDLADSLQERRLRRVFELMDPEIVGRIRDLRQHKKSTAGRLMTNELFAFLMDATIGEVAAEIRDNPGIDLTRHIFVLNDQNQLQGYVPSRNLIINSQDLPIRKVMQPVLHRVSPDATREEVIDLVERYKIPALPVVDESDVLQGVITYEDVVEVMEDIADETIAYMAGTSEDVSEHEPVYRRFLLRAPWLVVTLISGVTIAFILDVSSGKEWYYVVPLFVPLITGLSGNVGIQSSTVLVRSMATGEITARTRGDAILSEIALGLFTGSVFAAIAAVITWVFVDVPNAPGVVAAGILGASVTSATLASIAPFLFSRMGIDPAIAAGPIVTALNDTLSTLIFCAIAYLMLGSVV